MLVVSISCCSTSTTSLSSLYPKYWPSWSCSMVSQCSYLAVNSLTVKQFKSLYMTYSTSNHELVNNSSKSVVLSAAELKSPLIASIVSHYCTICKRPRRHEVLLRGLLPTGSASWQGARLGPWPWKMFAKIYAIWAIRNDSCSQNFLPKKECIIFVCRALFLSLIVIRLC